ncbi:DUF7525 family protein [halophilic archaeon]|uniref:DUF7525 family protein n=1 Tax=Halomicrococcus sp. SG-WS-1 TaxID=3439057 RepID=UPI000DDCEB0B|nr:hypothetical protein DMJ13_07700 [halophilic archaeon]
MAGNQAVASDKGLGLVVLFTLVAVAAAAVTFVSPGTETAAWGFAAAMVAGVLGVGATHLYWN